MVGLLGCREEPPEPSAPGGGSTVVSYATQIGAESTPRPPPIRGSLVQTDYDGVGVALDARVMFETEAPDSIHVGIALDGDEVYGVTSVWPLEVGGVVVFGPVDPLEPDREHLLVVAGYADRLQTSFTTGLALAGPPGTVAITALELGPFDGGERRIVLDVALGFTEPGALRISGDCADPPFVVARIRPELARARIGATDVEGIGSDGDCVCLVPLGSDATPGEPVTACGPAG